MDLLFKVNSGAIGEFKIANNSGIEFIVAIE